MVTAGVDSGVAAGQRAVAPNRHAGGGLGVFGRRRDGKTIVSAAVLRRADERGAGGEGAIFGRFWPAPATAAPATAAPAQLAGATTVPLNVSKGAPLVVVFLRKVLYSASPP